MMSVELNVLEKNGKFVVARNNQPVNLPKTDGSTVITEFVTKEDAEKYISILKVLERKKQHRVH